MGKGGRHQEQHHSLGAPHVAHPDALLESRDQTPGVHAGQKFRQQHLALFAVRCLPHEFVKFRVAVIGNALPGMASGLHLGHGGAGQQRNLLGVNPEVVTAGPPGQQVAMGLGKQVPFRPRLTGGVKRHHAAGGQHGQQFAHIARVQTGGSGNLGCRLRFFECVQGLEQADAVGDPHGQVEGPGV